MQGNSPTVDEKEYQTILEGYKASLRVANKLGGSNNSCSGQLGLLAEIRAVLDFKGKLAFACKGGWDSKDSAGNRVSVKATHKYADSRNIYIAEDSVDKYEYEDLCVYFWNEEKGDLELLYKGSVKKVLEGMLPTKRGKAKPTFSIKMRQLRELQEAGDSS